MAYITYCATHIAELNMTHTGRLLAKDEINVPIALSAFRDKRSSASKSNAHLYLLHTRTPHAWVIVWSRRSLLGVVFKCRIYQKHHHASLLYFCHCYYYLLLLLFVRRRYTWRAALEMKSVVFCSASTGPCSFSYYYCHHHLTHRIINGRHTYYDHTYIVAVFTLATFLRYY